MLFKDSKKRQEKSKMEKLVKQYGTSAFMYTQYPHKRFWKEKKNDEKYREILSSLANSDRAAPALLYLHIPYCKQLCYFCTCHMAITTEHSKVKDYMNLLYQEIDAFAEFITENNIKLNIKEIHLGGGSPTFIDIPEFDILCDKLGKLTNLKELDEFAIEVDPRRVERERLEYYGKKGINRLSFGIQDFDINVQTAINRIQPVELIENLLTPEIKDLFTNGINFDIICGLPNQTPETIKMTAQECIRLSPHRICLNYLHYSPVFAPHQLLMIDGNQGRPNNLPDFFERKVLFQTAQDTLENGGFVRTGYDHFARADDKVVEAMDDKKMHWNSLGVTPGEYTNIIGLGISSESTIGDYYFQNHYDMPDYISSIKKGEFPIYREHQLCQEDVIRKDTIQQIRNYFEVDLNEISARYNINSEQYFHDELVNIKSLEKDDILSYENGVIRLTEIGRQFTNIVCRTFDKYYTGSLLKQDLGQRDNYKSRKLKERV